MATKDWKVRFNRVGKKTKNGGFRGGQMDTRGCDTGEYGVLDISHTLEKTVQCTMAFVHSLFVCSV